MTRYKIFIRATKGGGLGGTGSLERYRQYDNKSYPNRTKAIFALDRYKEEKGHRSFDRALGAKYQIRSVATKKRQPNIFGGGFRF